MTRDRATTVRESWSFSCGRADSNGIETGQNRVCTLSIPPALCGAMLLTFVALLV